MSRDALIIGINNYAVLQPLVAPANDAEKIYELLERYGNFDINKKIICNDRNNRIRGLSIKMALKELFKPEGKQHPEMALFYFAGHGQRTMTVMGVNESYLAASDSQLNGDMGVSLSELAKLLDESPVRNQVIIFDCCYSGELYNLITNDKQHNRFFIAACRDYHQAYEQKEHGFLTEALLKVLDPANLDLSNNIDGQVTTVNILELLKNIWKNSIQETISRSHGDKITLTKLPPRQRICMVSSEYFPNVSGGLGVHVTELTKELTKFADIDLVLPYPTYPTKAYTTPPDGVSLSLHTLTSDIKTSYNDTVSWLRFAQHMVDIVEKISPKPTVIHCHDWVTVLGGIKCRWKMNIPLLFHVHLPNRTSLCSSAENLGILCADLVTVSSTAMLTQLRTRFPDKEIKVVFNGVDTTVFKPDNDIDTDTNPYVLFVGRMVEQKGVDHLLRAFVHIREKFPKVRLKIIGDEGPCKQGYERLAECLLIKEGVEFLKWQDGPTLSQFYQGASVVVVPSIYEPFGMTALEAMACARPVVASRTGGLQDFIKHGVTGYLAEPKDHLDLAQWIMRLLDQKDLRQTMGVKAGQMVHESTTYKWSSIAQQFAKHYETLSNKTIDFQKVPHREKLPQNKIDLKNKQAAEYVQQICSVTKDLDENSVKICETIFDWMVQQ